MNEIKCLELNKENNNLLNTIRNLENKLDAMEIKKPINPPEIFTPLLKFEYKHNINYINLFIYLIFFFILNIPFTIKIINIVSGLNIYINVIIRTIIFGLLYYLHNR